ncbi:hypothetical protein QR685DRAFT_430215 [Neurospora intermedia]|uniref:C3H1-type domain-containing protein n=1 Tax=Neurospora intermedia TaxID=5142 RepID=A0ABR3DPL7_NEUIN
MVPQPQFFVARPDTEVLRNDTGAIHRKQGPMVPLIAVDELPDWIDIGLPRELTVEQTTGLYNLGVVPYNEGTYRARIIEPNSHEEFVWRDSSNATLVSRGACAPGQRTMTHPEHSERVPYNTPAGPTGSDSSIFQKSPHIPHPSMASISTNPPRITRAEDEAMHTMRWADLVERSIARETEAQDASRHSALLAPPPSPQFASRSHPTVHRDDMSLIGTTSTADQRASVPHNTMATPSKPAAANTDVATPAASPPTVVSSSTGPGVNSSNTTPAAASSASIPQEYCRHWCQHGTCKWGTFCRHRHAMPTTLEGLLEVGLCEIPVWWIAATGIGMSSKAKQTAVAAGVVGSGASGGGPVPPPPVPCTPMAHNPHHMLPNMSGMTLPATAKKLSNRKLKAQQREFNQRLRLLSSMLIPPGYGSPHHPLRHPADALLVHGYQHGGVSGQQQQQQSQQQQQQQQSQQRFERKGEKTPLDRNRKNVKVTFNEDGTVSLVTADDGGKKGGAAADQGRAGSGGETVGGGSTPAGVDAGAGASSGAVLNAATGKPVAGDGGARDEADERKEKEGLNERKPVKGLAASMHAPKQDQGQAVVTIPGSMKATCEDENEGGSMSVRFVYGRYVPVEDYETMEVTDKNMNSKFLKSEPNNI